MNGCLKYWSSPFKDWRIFAIIPNADPVNTNNEYNIIREIPGGDYAVTSLSTDDDGEYLFIAYKNGTIKVMNIEEIEQENENEAKQVIDFI